MKYFKFILSTAASVLVLLAFAQDKLEYGNNKQTENFLTNVALICIMKFMAKAALSLYMVMAAVL
ncbi:MAG: hypothetical protein R2765_10700 [Ferruginibacter sp.]